ncbi:hypothetical protein [Candidatus Hecatella orcuttiae]|uniref:hypothetical protein n=1 Tax=Candidatus Hecatella orcuttiae TaxID=1935119 RepID=UPI002867EFDB|nr:hypothetical protein [Candidatus Hecatella orcuttiae]
MKVKISIKRSYGDIVLEGESFDDLVENLKGLPQWLDIVDSLILHTETPSTRKELLKGLVEYTQEGTVISLPRERLSDKEAICLLLFANEPNPLQPKEIARLLANSGRLSAGFGARLSELRYEGLILKEAGSYRLTATGRTMVEDMVQRLRS